MTPVQQRNLAIALAAIMLLCACLALVLAGWTMLQPGQPTISRAVTTPAPQQPVATERPVPVATVQPPVVVQPTLQPVQGCRVIHDYDLNPGMGEVATSGAFLHVEYWTDGQPEREVLLPGGRYKLTSPLKGHVFEYASECNEAQVRTQIDGHIARRLAQKANNAGFVDWKSTGLFQQVAVNR